MRYDWLVNCPDRWGGGFKLLSYGFWLFRSVFAYIIGFTYSLTPITIFVHTNICVVPVKSALPFSGIRKSSDRPDNQ